MDKNDGYRDYEFIADLYDHVVPYRERPDVTFYVDEAVDSGGPVLELGCGTGRVLIPTARAGVRITGLDLSPSMLMVCRKRMLQEPADVLERIELVQGDMRDFSIPLTYRLATIPFRPFQHLLGVDDQVACLACIHRHLVPGGMLVFDVFNPILESLTAANLGVEVGEEPEFTTPDGRRVVRRNRTVARDLLRQVIQVELIHDVTHPDGHTERLVQAFPMRYYFRYEVEHLLARCGFEVVDVFADFKRNPFGSIYPGDMIFRARKKA